MRPNFFVVGCQRCGTTWLYEMLKEHPEIFLPKKKELHFFDEHFDKGWKHYEAYFAGAKGAKAVGEITPSYVYDERALEILSTQFRHAKIIVLFRNPADRTYSQYWRHRVAGFTSLDFWEAIERHPHLVDRSLYYKQWVRFCRVFPEERRKCIFFEELREDTARQLRELLRFLEVDASFVPRSIEDVVNPIRFHRSQRLIDGICVLRDAFKRAGMSSVVSAAA